MSITLKQLEQLGREYHFDVDEARQFLGIEPKKRGRPTKKDSDSEDDTPRPKTNNSAGKKSPKSKEEKVSGNKRGPSGYNLFVKNQRVSVTVAGPLWKGLTDSKRETWNSKARAMRAT